MLLLVTADVWQRRGVARRRALDIKVRNLQTTKRFAQKTFPFSLSVRLVCLQCHLPSRVVDAMGRVKAYL